ncbi:MAG: DUF5074 domain-containing protein [Muribaculaceae bacterium]|nr:DUF5074 domain-containing protein [Muribaculaceae bacterium]
MKKTLLTFVTTLPLWLSVNTAAAQEGWIDWDRIQHWAGDPDGKKKCALVIDFQDEYGSEALVWGYRWNGTATGEDLVRAVASQSSALTVMIQYTGTMGSTLNGIGMSTDRENLDHLSYDFDRAALAGEVSFGYFSPNTSMGQETAPGYEAQTMCQQAIDRAKTTGIIEHPLNAFVYGYPAYDYDYWFLEEGYNESYDYRWRSGWYEGYWSYWHGPNDYDYMSYSGLGMSSTVLQDGYVQAWKYTPLNGEGYGPTGGELSMDLDYDILLYEEQMHEAEQMIQPVDQDKVNFWVGEGEKSATVVFQFNDGRGPENLVYGYRWSGGWDDNLSTVISTIAKADPRMNLTDEGGNIKITYDSDDDGQIGSKDHSDTDNTWNYYVKRVVDTDFSKVNAGRWLNPNAVLILSHQPAEMASVELPYQLYRPAIDSEQVLTLPDNIEYALDDDGLLIPMFIQVPEGYKFNQSAFMWTRDANITAVTTSMGTNNYMGKINGYKNFKPTTGTLKVRGSVTPSGSTKSEYVYSNDMTLDLRMPEIPVTSIRYENSQVTARLNHKVENRLVIEPADATYTQLAYSSSKSTVAGVVSTTGVVTTTKTAGEATITAQYSIDPEIKSEFILTSSLVHPLEDVTFECANEDGIITLTPKGMSGLFPIITPEDPDIADVSVTLSENGDAKDNYIATMYQVNMWDADNNRTRPYELSGHRVGECKLTVTSQDGTGFKKEFTVRVVEPEREPAIDYNTGTIMLNEEWFGHTNGGLNWYSPDYEITYQAYERENPGMSFGCTSQYGIIYDGKLIVCSKQAVDGGDPLPGGGRVVIADAATLKRLGSIDDLVFGDETRSNDGRAAVGAGPGRAYVGSNSGIYIIDTDNYAVIGKIQGTDPDGNASDLYSGQIGDMVLAGNHVFALRQSTGIYIIDIRTDKVVKAIADANVQGLTQAADGSVWYATINATGQSIFVALDHTTFEEIDRVEVPAEYGAVTCGWGAWRTTQFTGAHSVNSLFFSPGSSISNGGAGVIYRYDIEDGTFTRLAQIAGLEAHTPGMKQGAYGTIRYDDRSGEIIAGTTESKASGHYRYNWTHFIDAKNGGIVRSIELRPYYWFQAHAIFPDAYAPDVEDIDDITIDLSDEPVTIEINATDRDNNDANIHYSLLSIPVTTDNATTVSAIDAKLEGNILTLTPQAVGKHTVGFAVESNGKTVKHAVNVEVRDKSTGLESIDTADGRIMAHGNEITVDGYEGYNFTVVNVSGMTVDWFTAETSHHVHTTSLANGVYIVIGDNGVTKKIILK